MEDKDEINSDIIDAAMEDMEKKQSIMTREEMVLLHTINNNLAKRKFHLRLAYLKPAHELYEYIPPIHKWTHELPEVTMLISKLIKEYSQKI
jgi:transcriptional/translational regulatory protein YebC/TACO1